MGEVNKALEIFDYSFRGKDGRIEKVDNRERVLKIPETIDGQPVKVLGTSTFANRRLEKVSMPITLEEIGDCAFYDNRLENVTVPPNIKRIGYMAFSENPIMRIVLPPSLEFIHEDTFNDTTDALVLVCQVGSYAHEYAEHGHRIELLTEDEMNNLYSSYYRNV